MMGPRWDMGTQWDMEDPGGICRTPMGLWDISGTWGPQWDVGDLECGEEEAEGRPGCPP